jgi:hypothetical protein
LLGLDLRQVEQLVHEAQQVAPARPDPGEPHALALREGAVQPHVEQVRVAQHRVDRRAELVAHRREELRLGRVRRLGALLRRDQRLLRPLPRGEVARDLGEADQVPVVLVAERREHQLRVEEGAVLPLPPRLAHPAPVRLGVAQVLLGLAAVPRVGRVEGAEVLADDLVGPPPLHPLGADVPRRDAAARIQGEDRVVLHLVDEEPEALLRAALRLMQARPLDRRRRALGDEREERDLLGREVPRLDRLDVHHADDALILPHLHRPAHRGPRRHHERRAQQRGEPLPEHRVVDLPHRGEVRHRGGLAPRRDAPDHAAPDRHPHPVGDLLGGPHALAQLQVLPVAHHEVHARGVGGEHLAQAAHQLREQVIERERRQRGVGDALDGGELRRAACSRANSASRSLAVRC